MEKIIAASGPMTVAQYMELALTHPEFGYYMRKDPLGVKGDFTTAPEISQVFGELVGAWLASQWLAMGKPQCALAEPGPGRGTLMADILRATKHVAGFHDAVSLHLIETSPALKAKQWQALSGKHPHIEWHGAFSEIPAKPLLLVANEFFDALPVRQFVFDGEWKERMVEIKNGNLSYIVMPAEAGIQSLLRRKRGALDPGQNYNLKVGRDDNVVYEHSPAAQAIARAIGAHIKNHGGAALIVDYGHEGKSGDTLQAVRDHQYHDPLIEPGTADLTCHVDFGLLKEAAQESGAAVYGPAPQGIFLNALGANRRAAKLCEAAGGAQRASILSGVERLLSLKQMGYLFKVLAITHPSHPRPEGF